MKRDRLSFVVLCVMFGIWQSASAATVTPSLAKTKTEAEAKGYIFLTNHDEIISEARKEGKLRVVSGLSPESLKTMISAFQKKYPIIDISAHETTGGDEHQRILPELKAGMNKEWDAISMANDFYNEYGPYQKKFDILGMSQNGVIQIHRNMIDPSSRSAVSVTDMIQIGVTYNKNLIAREKTPESWEDYLKPEFRGKKIMVDIRPTEIAALVPAWGLEKTLDFARKLVAQQPGWVRGGSRAVAALLAGEYPMAIGQNYRSVRRSQLKDRTGTIAYKMLEPVPVRPSESLAITSTSSRPHAALLWWNFKPVLKGRKLWINLSPLAAPSMRPAQFKGRK